MKSIDLRGKTYEEWLEIRKDYLGGSDIAAALGMSPYKQPLELYLEKRGELESEDISHRQAIEWGNRLEDVVATAYTDKTGYNVRRRNFMFLDERQPYLAANIDREIVGQKKVLECKTAGAFMRDQWGEGNVYSEGGEVLATDERIPDHYALQLQQYMSVCGRREGDLAVLIGGQDFRMYTLRFDGDLDEMIRTGLQQFWTMVQEGTPPPMDYSHSTTDELLKRRYPLVDKGIIQLPSTIQYWHEVAMDAKEHIKRYTAVADGAKAHILEAMENHPVGVLHDGTLYDRKITTVAAKEVKGYSFIALRHRTGKTADKILTAFEEQDQ